MTEPNELSQRELLYQAFPKWVVDWLLAPFEDESGPLVVALKNAAIGLALGILLVELGSEALLLRAIRQIGLTIAILILCSGLIRAVLGNGDRHD